MTIGSQREFLRTLVARLDAVGIPHMFSGSLASSFHGEPRATKDVDIVISATAEQVARFVASLGDEFYADTEAGRRACIDRGTFNVIHWGTGWKADLIVCKDRAFSREEFSRRRPMEMLGMRLFIVSPEDTILSKLEWAKKGESERQLRDAAGVLLAQGARLDRSYLLRWAAELGVSDLLSRLLGEVDRQP